MLTAAMNAVAMMRFGAMRAMRGGGDVAAILVAILLGIVAVIWAISRADGRESAKNLRSVPPSSAAGAPE
jgi:hypothetical protein